ncbi:MAG: magnesium transporter [Oligoflexia bacterium]|nr:magnesium transporter [Oligoflexia bacterium]
MKQSLDQLEQSFYSVLGEINEQNKTEFDLKELLLDIRDADKDLYQKLFLKIPKDLVPETLAELPSHLQDEISDQVSSQEIASIAKEMDSDDAASLIKNISESDEEKAQDILQGMGKKDRKIIEKLISYDDNLAGAHMQTELFSASLDEAIWEAVDRLRVLKQKDLVENIYHVYVVDKKREFICTIGLEELIICNKSETFESIIDKGQVSISKISSNHNEAIYETVERVSDYNLSAIPVVNDENKLLGRITSDDIYDLIQDKATDEIYHMAGVNADAEEAESFLPVIKTRAFWLLINLFTAIAASYVISVFDTTIQSMVALAILMPIIASMGGNAGTQSLTVTVRQLAIGEISSKYAFATIKKEVLLSLVNGAIFALLIGLMAHLWFGHPKLGLVVCSAIVINLIFAGLFGSLIPLALVKLKVDPAIASTVLLTTVTDIVGFFAFLGLAQFMLF